MSEPDKGVEYNSLISLYLKARIIAPTEGKHFRYRRSCQRPSFGGRALATTGRRGRRRRSASWFFHRRRVFVYFCAFAKEYFNSHVRSEFMCLVMTEVAS